MYGLLFFAAGNTAAKDERFMAVGSETQFYLDTFFDLSPVLGQKGLGVAQPYGALPKWQVYY
jgi:hypothetical protein